MMSNVLFTMRLALLFIAALTCIMAPCMAQPTSGGSSSGFSSSDGTDGNQGACQARPTLTCFIAATQSVDAQGQTSTVAGKIDFTPFYNAASRSCRTRITGTISGLGTTTHGWHVHQKGDISSTTGTATGDHYNPFAVRHVVMHAESNTHPHQNKQH
jgi:Cu/Zn superoxide dismutase